MDLHYKQELQVGFLVIVAATVLIAGLIWLSGRSFGGGAAKFEVRFASIQGLSSGDPVHISGVRVGRVAGVDIEGVDRILVRLEVRRDFRPRSDAQIAVKSLDFLGAKFIDYRPGTSGDFIEDGVVLEGLGEEDIASVATDLAGDMAELVGRGQDLLSPDMVQQVQATLVAAERALDVVARVGTGDLVEDATAMLTSLRSAAARLDSTLGNPAIQESLSQMDEVVEGLKEMTEGLAVVTTALGSVMQKIDDGQGSIGMAINDSTLHQDMHEVLVSLRELLDDIRENPGRYGPKSIKIF
ncbi:MAG: MlaD family protein [Gemmatimonadales bacterium]